MCGFWLLLFLTKLYSQTDIFKQFNRQFNQIKLFMWWNEYPLFVRNSFIKRLKNNKNNKKTNKSDERKISWIRFLCLGERGDQMKRNLKGFLKEKVVFETFHTTRKLLMFHSSKHQSATDQKANLTYCIACPK